MDTVEQNIQDDDYGFPYHYVPQFEPGFTQSYTLPWGIYYASGLEYVTGNVKQLNPSSIIDIGTGDGRLALELKKALPQANVLGVDYSPRAISLAKALNPSLDFKVMDVTTEKPSQTFELATLIEVFEHIPIDQAKNFASAIPKLISEHGELIVTVPHANNPVTPKHFQHFTSSSLIAYFATYFSVEEIAFLDKRSQWVRLIKRILHNDYFTLNHWGIRNRIYGSYKKHFLLCSKEQECGRLYVRFKKKPTQQLSQN